jgi:hypothetical protein
MSVLKVNKTQQLEGGPFTTMNNLCNIYVEPQAGVVDMSKSYLELETVFTNQGGDEVTENVFLGYVDEDDIEEVNYTPACLIKHCKLQCEKKGLLEENRYINVLNQTLENITKESQDHVGSYLTGRSDPILLDRDTKKANLQVPLSDILGVGNVAEFPVEWMGKLQLQLEFENQNTLAYQKPQGFALEDIEMQNVTNTSGSVAPVNSLTTVPIFGTTGTNVTQFFPPGVECSFTFTRSDQGTPTTVSRVVESAVLNSDKTVTLTLASSLTNLPNGVNVTGITLNDNGVDNVAMNDVDSGDNHLVLVQGSTNVEFNVNDSIAISYSTTAGGVTTYDILLTKVVEVDDSGTQPEYTIEDELPDGDVTDIRVVEHNWASLNWIIQKVNLVLYSLPGKKAEPTLAYITYHVEMDNMLATTDYRRQFDTEENTDKAMMLTPTNTLVSTIDSATSFRVSVDNIDTTNRDVFIDYINDNTLYYDRLIQNMDGVVSLNLINDNTRLFLIPQQMPTDGMRHVLNVRLYSDLPQGMQAKVVYLFKKVAMEVNK